MITSNLNQLSVQIVAWEKNLLNLGLLVSAITSTRSNFGTALTEGVMGVKRQPGKKSLIMKILQVTGSFLPVKGGGPYFIHYLTQHLENAGDDCRIVTTGHGDQTDMETVAIDRARSIDTAGFPLSPTFPNLLRQTINDYDPDVIHVHYPLPFFPELTSLLASLKDIPLLLTSHGMFEMTWDSAIGVFGSIYNRTLLQLSLTAADTIHVSNNGILERIPLFDRYTRKVSTLPMGVDTNRFDPNSVTGTPPYPDDNTDTILFVGTFRRYKGLKYLITAFAEIADRLDCRLVLVGDGPIRDKVESHIESYSLGSAVTITGHIDDDTLLSAYAAANIFVLPSPTIAESFGLVTLEAMAMGLPVVVTSGSGIGYVLREHSPGTVVEPRDPHELAEAIENLLTNPKRYQHEVNEGHQLVETEFAWDKLIDEYRQLFRQTANL